MNNLKEEYIKDLKTIIVKIKPDDFITGEIFLNILHMEMLSMMIEWDILVKKVNRLEKKLRDKK